MKIAIKDIISRLKPIKYIGDESCFVSELVQVDGSHSPTSICWCSDKNSSKLEKITAGCVIISSTAFESIKNSKPDFNCIVTDNPRRFFMQLVSEFFAPEQSYGIVHPSAMIHATVKFNQEKVFIGENVVIEAGCEIGDFSVIMHNSVILSNTKIGSNCRIGSNCTIGGIGFGYEKDEDGKYVQIPHLGNVILENHVEIGNNVTIDRAVIGSTVLGKNVKVDNLVHIAHGVTIGENSLIIANAMIAGSVSIGKNVWVAPSASILQKSIIGDDATVGMASNVLSDVESGTVVAGNPAKKLR